MLSEEALLLVACLAVAALVIVALLEVIWPSQGRHARARARYRHQRRSRPRDDRSAYRRPAPAARDAAAPRLASPTPRRVAETVPGPTAGGGYSVFARPGGPPRDAPPPAIGLAPPGPERIAVPAPPEAPVPVLVRAAPAAAPTPAPDASVRVSDLPLEECFALFEEKSYADVVARAVPALERYADAVTDKSPLAHEVAALWSLTGLSKQALNDEEGARTAFEAAIHAAPASERSTYQRHLAALGLTVGRRLTARAESLSETAGEERVSALRHAVLWLRQGLACAPGDAYLGQALERSCAELWNSYGRLVAALVHRQEFHGARRLIREALAEDGFPDDRREAFGDLLAATWSGEIGQLTAHAIRVMQDEHEREALASLQRAEALLSSIPGEALTPKRREEVNRRLWWGYTRLGVRRVESGEYEDAVEPLFHALKLGEVEPERQQETRQALIRALEGVTEARVESIDQLLKAGNRDAAAQERDRLRRLLRESLELGLTKSELTSALPRTRQLLDQVEPSP